MFDDANFVGVFQFHVHISSFICLDNLKKKKKKINNGLFKKVVNFFLNSFKNCIIKKNVICHRLTIKAKSHHSLELQLLASC